MPTLEDISNKIRELPEDIASAITDPAIGEKLSTLSKKHSLSVPDMGSVELEMRYVMLGFTHPNDFIGKIEALGIEKEKARAIAHDINEQIFKEIRDSLKTLYGGSTDTQEEALSAPDARAIEPSPLAERLTEHVTTRPTENHASVSPQKSFDPYREPVE